MDQSQSRANPLDIERRRSRRPPRTPAPGVLLVPDVSCHHASSGAHAISPGFLAILREHGGLLGPHIKPMLARLTGLLGAADDPAEEVRRRIKIETVGTREFNLDQFQTVGSALLRRKRLMIRYHARGTNETTDREISPQRLIYYRGNWYLDAWCHLRVGLRSFSVDAIERVEILEKRTKDVADKRLDEVLGSGYGIFAGDKVTWAMLKFTPARARRVANERWHPTQESRVLKDGSYELKVPFSDDRELIMDILKYGSDCEVVSPEALREKVAAEISQAGMRYLT